MALCRKSVLRNDCSTTSEKQSQLGCRGRTAALLNETCNETCSQVAARISFRAGIRCPACTAGHTHAARHCKQMGVIMRRFLQGVPIMRGAAKVLDLHGVLREEDLAVCPRSGLLEKESKLDVRFCGLLKSGMEQSPGLHSRS